MIKNSKMIKIVMTLLEAIRLINGACTSNTLALKSGGALAGSCFICDHNSASYQSSHILGNFDSVFTNSDPTNCPVTTCAMKDACTSTNSPAMFVIGSSPQYQITFITRC